MMTKKNKKPHKISCKPYKIILLQDQRVDSANLGTRAFTQGILKMANHYIRAADVEVLYVNYKKSKYYFEKLNKKKCDKKKLLESWIKRSIFIAAFLEKIRIEKRVWKILENLADNIFLSYKKNPLNIFLKFANMFFALNIINQHILSKIRRSDIILMNGHDIVNDLFVGRLFTLLFYSYLGKKLGKYVAAINQTVEIEHPVGVELIKKIYCQFDYVAVRDPLSRQRLIDIGLPDPFVHLSADGAFFIEPNHKIDIAQIIHKEAISEGTIGINIRADRIKKDSEMWAEIIKNIEQKFNKKILYISTSKDEDSELIKQISSLTSISELEGRYDYDEIISIFNKLDLVITDRFHGTVFSILANTNVIPIAPYKSKKINGLFKFFDYPIPVLDPISQKNLPILYESIKVIYKRFDECKLDLKKALPKLRKYSTVNIPRDFMDEMAWHNIDKENQY